MIYLKVVNGNLKVWNGFITEGRQMTYLNDDVASGAGSITVFSITGFAKGNYYVQIGKTGSGNAELIKMHASTDPTGNTITLAANTSFAHNANEPVYFVNFNQIEYSRATTATGVKSVLATSAIDPTKEYSTYSDITNSTGFAFARFKNSDATTYSAFSAASPYLEEEFYTVEYIMNEALREAKTSFSEKLTPNYLLQQINECLRDARRRKNKLSWSQSFNYALGQTAQGTFRYSLPTDLYDKYSKKAIEAVRLTGYDNIEFVDPNYFFNSLLLNVKYTQVTSTGAVGATSLNIDNSYDFDESGSVTVGSQTLTYTGVTRSTTAGALTGIPASGTGSITTEISADEFVFQNADTGEPRYFTLYNGYLYIWPMPDSSFDNFNLNMDYFKAVTAVDSLDDNIDYIQCDMIKYWLIWKIRAFTRNDGITDVNDPAYKLYMECLATMIRKDRDLNIKVFRNAYAESLGGDDDMEVNPRQVRDGTLR